MIKIRYIISIILLLISCSENIEENITTLKIEFDKSETIQTISADSIFESVEYVALETTTDNLIGEIERIKIFGGYIYILDKTQHTIFIFDKSGRYKFKLDKRGKSNAEYLRISDYNVDENYIYILDDSKRKLLIYNKTDLIFVRSIDLDTNYSSFSLVGDKTLLFANFSSFTSDCYNLAILSNDNIETRFKEFPKSQLGIGSSSYPFFTIGNETYATFRYEYSIYKIIGNKVSKILNVDFGEENIYSKELQKASSNERNYYRQKFEPTMWPISEINNIIIHDSSYIFSFIFRTLTYTCFYNPNDGNYRCGVVAGSDKFPLAGQQFSNYDKGEIIQTISCSLLNQIVKNRGKSHNLPDELIGLNEYGNPILMFCELKDTN